jgi:hypothetical protein
MESTPCHLSDSAPENVAGESRTVKSQVLEFAAGATQSFAPVSSICAHLNAFHVYADDPTRCVETNHYCAHLTEDVRQCLLYDSPDPGARLIGVEYMITPKLYNTLDAVERKLWHSHVFEVKSGMLFMPQPNTVPQAVWDKAETAEMEDIIELYGKVYHLWQVDKGHKIPLGEPKLMTSFTADGQMPDFETTVGVRDNKFHNMDWKRKKALREGITEPDIHPDADQAWKMPNQ